MKTPVIAVFAGGTSAEREVSLRSGAATAAAASCSFPTRLFIVESDAVPAELDPNTHVVLSTLHGTFGEDGGMQRLLEAAHIEFAGCGSTSSTLTMDKTRTKQRVSARGVPVVPAVVFDGARPPPAADLTRELGEQIVLKPNGEGSSVGLCVCENPEDLAATLREPRSGLWIAETRIRGKELTVGILDGKPMGVVEIAPKSGTYDYRSKYTAGATDYFAPARIDDATAVQVRTYAETAFSECGCRDFGRVDFMLEPDGRPFLLEINTLPGMTETSLLPKSARCTGRDFVALVREMVGPAIGRFNARNGSTHHE